MSIDDARVFLGMPVNRDIHPLVLQSMLQGTSQHIKHFHLETGYTDTIDRKRNACVRKFLETDCTHLVFWDSDTIATMGALKKLLEADKPVIGATIYQKGGEHTPCFGEWMPEQRRYRAKIPFTYNQIRQVDIVGTGFMLIKREVLEQLEDPWFQCHERGNAWEDIYFCLKCKDAGIPVYVDTGLHLGHLATPYIITNETYEMHLYWRLIKTFERQGRIDEFRKVIDDFTDVSKGVEALKSQSEPEQSIRMIRSLGVPMKVDTLIVGMDGLDGEVVSQVKTPMLDRMGKHGVMKSIPPYHTGPCWMSMYTGLKPEDHGVTSEGWVKGVPYTQHLKVKTIWQQLPDVGVFNMPMTWPPFKVDGWMVSGFPCVENSKDHPMTYPEDYVKYLPEKYISDITSGPTIRGELEENVLETSFYEVVRRIAKGRIPNFRRIYNDYPVKTAAIGYTFPDRFGHHGHYEYTFKLLREILRDLFREFEYKRLIIISDHGFKGIIHGPDAFYLTNFGASPESLTDIYQIIRDAAAPPTKRDIIKKAYREYVSNVSDDIWASSWEVSRYMMDLVELRKPKRILDLGSGFSSYALRQSDAEVWSVDTDKDWLEKTGKFLRDHGVSDENMVAMDDFEFTGMYDLIFLDIGLAQRDRAPLFQKVLDHCSGAIILDDMHSQEYRRQAKEFFKDCEIVDLREETLDKYLRYAWMIIPRG